MGQGLSNFWNQTYFLPQPTFTEAELPDQTGKVVIVTGGYTGIGLELAKLLYQKNATIYIAGRSADKGSTAVNALRNAFPSSAGKVEFLQLDLADLSTIKASAEQFRSKEKRLDVLVNNAGVMNPPAGSKSEQGFELQLATNVFGPFLFTQLLLPILVETAKTAEKGSVRVSWAASIGIDVVAPTGGVLFNEDDSVQEIQGQEAYGQTKSANVMLGVEAAKRWTEYGIVSNSFNPGNLASELDRHLSWAEILFIKMVRYPVKMGAYTELFAGWSPETGIVQNGSYIIPWGRLGSYNTALQNAIKPKSEGGQGSTEKLWYACERICANYK